MTAVFFLPIIPLHYTNFLAYVRLAHVLLKCCGDIFFPPANNQFTISVSLCRYISVFSDSFRLSSVFSLLTFCFLRSRKLKKKKKKNQRALRAKQARVTAALGESRNKRYATRVKKEREAKTGDGGGSKQRAAMRHKTARKATT